MRPGEDDAVPTTASSVFLVAPVRIVAEKTAATVFIVGTTTTILNARWWRGRHSARPAVGITVPLTTLHVLAARFTIREAALPILGIAVPVTAVRMIVARSTIR
jgi:hypothetical protein